MPYLQQSEQFAFNANFHLINFDVVGVFQYEKNNKEYWEKARFLKQVDEKDLSLLKILFPGHCLLFSPEMQSAIQFMQKMFFISTK